MPISARSSPSSPPILRPVLGQSPTWAMRQLMWDEVGYHPSQEQLMFHRGLDWQGRESRKKLGSGGEQSGKSLSAAMDGFSYSLHSNIGWVVAPRYEDARPEMDYLHQALSQIGAVKGASFPNTPGPFRIELHTGGFI